MSGELNMLIAVAEKIFSATLERVHSAEWLLREGSWFTHPKYHHTVRTYCIRTWIFDSSKHFISEIVRPRTQKYPEYFCVSSLYQTLPTRLIGGIRCRLRLRRWRPYLEDIVVPVAVENLWRKKDKINIYCPLNPRVTSNTLWDTIVYYNIHHQYRQLAGTILYLDISVFQIQSDAHYL